MYSDSKTKYARHFFILKHALQMGKRIKEKRTKILVYVNVFNNFSQPGTT